MPEVTHLINDFENPFYTGRSFYHMIGSYLMSPSILPSTIGSTPDSTIRHGGLFTCLYHGNEDVGFNLVPLIRFEQTLDSIKAREENVWLTTFANATKYHAQRRSSILTFETNGNNYRIAINSTLPDSIFNHPLSVRISALQLNSTFSNLAQVQLRANNLSMPFIAEGDSTIQFNLPVGITFDLHGGTTGILTRQKSKNLISILPNPIQGNVLKLQMLRPPASRSEVNIKNLNGQNILSQFCEPKQIKENKIELKSGQIPKGIYVVETYLDGYKQVSRPLVAE